MTARPAACRGRADDGQPAGGGAAGRGGRPHRRRRLRRLDLLLGRKGERARGRGLAPGRSKRAPAPAPCQRPRTAVGGGESLRAYWNMYLSRALMLVYVVDAADHARLPVAKTHLHQMIQQDSLLPVVVLANKQDLPGAYSITEMHDALALSEIGDDRKLFLIGTHLVKEGSEIPSSLQDARELIIQLVSDCQ
ncbi:ADP-ribosylation factor-like protein 9 isoform X3 [Rhinatrema bivittatum]|uniref:ADP-ribosylation factor-like protein 9 isoform X3 n=1 Tax=Rhinatrema bivittatum TaxID=194408 RepID=UPI0011261845|nr:ADP-ribosylation factor-like protein 9 isoform X3 [Rhinatrema bivittatum]